MYGKENHDCCSVPLLLLQLPHLCLFWSPGSSSVCLRAHVLFICTPRVTLPSSRNVPSVWPVLVQRSSLFVVVCRVASAVFVQRSDLWTVLPCHDYWLRAASGPAVFHWTLFDFDPPKPSYVQLMSSSTVCVFLPGGNWLKIQQFWVLFPCWCLCYPWICSYSRSTWVD